ncbi:MAG: type II toxin-antitoxin system RelE/ParE family toxin [Rhizobiaceae bacterium]|nr:type II toxin-antitoxin system RelE/ParE family toxin [Rhizobiaceae bacterium]
MMKVFVSGQVRRFLRSERDYLGRYSSTAAGRVARRLADAVKLLSEFPMAGSAMPLLPDRQRRLVVDDYVLDYEVVGGEVRILNMRHGRQQDPYLDQGSDEDEEAS